MNRSGIPVRPRPEHSADLDRLSAEDITRRLAALDPSPVPAQESTGTVCDGPRPAAVLIPVFRAEGRWRLLYIRRSENGGDRHSGEVAFPGGRCEDQDADRAATALREAEEEIGLDPSRVKLLGELRSFRTVSNFLVTPVVGLVSWPLSLRPDPGEVARVFSLPLSWLDDPVHRRVRAWPAPDHPQVRQVVFFEEFDGERLWGVSARITLDFIDCLKGSR